jgi:hypothetical protein
MNPMFVFFLSLLHCSNISIGIFPHPSQSYKGRVEGK